MLDFKATISTPCAVAATLATPPKYGSLDVRRVAHPSRRCLQTITKARELESVEAHDVKRITLSRRSLSCFELGSDKRRYRTIHIGEGSEELRQLAQTNMFELFKTASSSNFNNSLLARKTLRFRKILALEAETEPSC